MQPRETPCGSCPYRKDCPSGVWAGSEYEKLIQYDAETFAQPHGVFMCHSDRDEVTMCRGWLDTHEKVHLLSLRLAMSMGELTPDIVDLAKSSVPCFESGTEAAEHGMADIEAPAPDAKAVVRKLIRLKRKQRRKRE